MSFKVGDRTLKSRLFIGTGKLPSYALISPIVEKTGVDVLTVAVRKINPDQKGENVLDYIPKDCVIMVNTSGARNHKEAVKIAEIGSELTGSDWIKIEIETDSKYLMPDNMETLKAADILVEKGFKVFPYISPDLVVAKKLEKIGVSAVMPLASPIGTNKGIGCETLLKAIINEINVPVIIDAGIGRPSHAAHAMELGADAVLINTAIATAKDPVRMAVAFSKAVEGGRIAYEIGILQEREYAEASSPLTGFLRGVGDD
ncbi:thiazole synthase [Caldanaerobius polysaccharolyticus]|uniref:thiazole synthase n=1 Tax=Caldanaerobius polysaccharolyticus TaxID=44256 RepID=UPI00047DFF3D|nr:thiazole synthase [Caldanaerobius polysaccharolyticus]